MRPAYLLKCRFLISIVLPAMYFFSPSLVPANAQNPPQTTPSTKPAIASTATLRASPRVIQPIGGKLPGSMTLAVLANCNDPTAPDLTNDSLQITGSGLSLAAAVDQKKSKCAIQAGLTIDPNTPAGDYAILVEDQNGNPIADTPISVLDNTAGPIPPGLAPEVDVLWGVMAQNNCSDTFGKRVADRLYCVQLKIGNNSGHPIQIAGVGFTRNVKALESLGAAEVKFANLSYASTRAVLVQSQVWSTRNVIYNTLDAAGIIMTASTPFFSGAGMKSMNAKSRFQTFSSIVSGPLLAAFNIVFPDPIVTQLKNLDDQTFRDNMVIPNNSQAQTVVFVEKANLKYVFHDMKIEIEQEISDTKNKPTERTKQALGEISKGLDDTANNSTHKRWQVWTDHHNPFLVKLALGNVIIVGDLIEYLGRVQVQSTAAAGGITVTVNPASAQLPIAVPQQFTATVANDQNAQGVTWTVAGSNCTGTGCGTLSNQTATTVSYTPPPTQPAPDNTVTLTAASKADGTKSATAKITILPAISLSAVNASAAAVAHASTTSNLSITVQNDPASAGVKWSLSGPACPATNCGQVTPGAPPAPGGPFTAVFTPNALAPPAAYTVTVTATSITDPSKSQQVTINVN